MNRWSPGIIAVLLVLAFWVTAALYFGVHNGSDNGQALANQGQFFGVLSALFAGLAFAGVCATIPFLMAQAKAASDQVKVSQRQAEIASEATASSARQALFLSLSDHVGEVISDPEIAKVPGNLLPSVEPGIPDIVSKSGSDSEFLKLVAELFSHYTVPIHDRFRRQALFRALEKLVSSSSDFQKQLFKDALNAQIHDRAAWMIIIKSLAEADVETMRIYGELGISFEVLHASPSLRDEVKRRFSPHSPG
jgi:hypothetical protein